jgi:hypothetical protein
MIYEIDSDLLTRLDDKHSLARLLAVHSAAVNDRIEQEIQDERRRQIETQPNPTSADVLERAESDKKTVYVAGSRGRRTIVLSPPPEVKLDSVPEREAVLEPEPEPVVAAPPESFLSRVWKWLCSFPI